MFLTILETMISSFSAKPSSLLAKFTVRPYIFRLFLFWLPNKLRYAGPLCTPHFKFMSDIGFQLLSGQNFLKRLLILLNSVLNSSADFIALFGAPFPPTLLYPKYASIPSPC
jgi:hypothetical protein